MSLGSSACPTYGPLPVLESAEARRAVLLAPFMLGLPPHLLPPPRTPLLWLAPSRCSACDQVHPQRKRTGGSVKGPRPLCVCAPWEYSREKWDQAFCFIVNELRTCPPLKQHPPNFLRLSSIP